MRKRMTREQALKFVTPKSEQRTRLQKFIDHFDNNVMEHPRSLWRKIWSWGPLYWLRCHTFTKYHIVDCRNPSYDWGWHDRCSMIVDANFAILCDYIENEHPFDVIDWSSDVEHAFAASEMVDLYMWWNCGRFEEQDHLDQILKGVNLRVRDWFKKIEGGEYDGLYEYVPDTNPKWEEWKKENDRLDAKEQEMLERLIRIRRHLWT